VYYRQYTTVLSHSDKVLYISSHQGSMFRPQFGHHQASTEHIKRYNKVNTQWDPISFYSNY